MALLLRSLLRQGSRAAAAMASLPGAPALPACGPFLARPGGIPAASSARWLSIDATGLDKKLFSSKPASLEVEPFGYLPRDDVETSPFKKFLLWGSGYHTKEAQLLRCSDNLLDSVITQSENTELFDAVGLPKAFATTYGMMVLHMWLMLQRLRQEGEDGERLSQLVYDAWQDDVELRVRKEGVKVRVRKWLTELEKNFYGAAVAYDKALKGGQGELEKALWLNVYGENEGQPSRGCHMLARYVRRELAGLAMTSPEAIMSGFVRFSGDIK